MGLGALKGQMISKLAGFSPIFVLYFVNYYCLMKNHSTLIVYHITHTVFFKSKGKHTFFNSCSSLDFQHFTCRMLGLLNLLDQLGVLLDYLLDSNSKELSI